MVKKLLLKIELFFIDMIKAMCLGFMCYTMDSNSISEKPFVKLGTIAKK